MPVRPKPPKSGETKNQGPSGAQSPRAAADGLGAEEDAFDLWLRQSLQQAFGAIAEEPVPEDILSLIEEARTGRERLRRRRQAKPGG